MLGRVLGEVVARNGVLGEVLGKMLLLLVLRRDKEEKHFFEHFSSTPFLAGTSPSTLPSTFGGLGVYTSEGGRSVRNIMRVMLLNAMVQSAPAE